MYPEPVMTERTGELPVFRVRSKSASAAKTGAAARVAEIARGARRLRVFMGAPIGDWAEKLYRYTDVGRAGSSKLQEMLPIIAGGLQCRQGSGRRELQCACRWRCLP